MSSKYFQKTDVVSVTHPVHVFRKSHVTRRRLGSDMFCSERPAHTVRVYAIETPDLRGQCHIAPVPRRVHVFYTPSSDRFRRPSLSSADNSKGLMAALATRPPSARRWRPLAHLWFLLRSRPEVDRHPHFLWVSAFYISQRVCCHCCSIQSRHITYPKRRMTITRRIHAKVVSQMGRFFFLKTEWSNPDQGGRLVLCVTHSMIIMYNLELFDHLRQ